MIVRLAIFGRGQRNIGTLGNVSTITRNWTLLTTHAKWRRRNLASDSGVIKSLAKTYVLLLLIFLLLLLLSQ